jgi:hypothetical protein
MIIKIGKGTFNVDGVMKLGKSKFIQTHQHLDDPEGAYAEIEKASVKEKKPKDEK